MKTTTELEIETEKKQHINWYRMFLEDIRYDLYDFNKNTLHILLYMLEECDFKMKVTLFYEGFKTKSGKNYTYKLNIGKKGKDKILSKSSVQKSLTELIEKDYIMKFDANSYMINPKKITKKNIADEKITDLLTDYSILKKKKNT